MTSQDDRTAWDALADDYHEESITPFAEDVDFRLAHDIETLFDAWNREQRPRPYLAVDFGCGPGDSLDPLARRDDTALVGMDFAPRMLDRAEVRMKGFGRAVTRHDSLTDAFGPAPGAPIATDRVHLVRADLRELTPLENTVDLALSINSICPSNADDAATIFTGIARSVRPGGAAIYVVPAFDSTEYLFALAEEHGDDLDLGEIDRANGLLIYEGGEPQKHLTPEELRRYCREARLEIEVLEKIEYPWHLMEEAGWGNYPGQPPLWDWYLLARPV